jgi:hypothetical protein
MNKYLFIILIRIVTCLISKNNRKDTQFPETHHTLER